MVLDDCCISILPFSCREFVFNVYSFDFIFIKVWPFCNYYCLFLGFKILLIFWKFWYIYLYPLSVPRWQKLFKYFTNFALKYLHQLCADGVSPVLHVKKNFAPKIFKVFKRCSYVRSLSARTQCWGRCKTTVLVKNLPWNVPSKALSDFINLINFIFYDKQNSLPPLFLFVGTDTQCTGFYGHLFFACRREFFPTQCVYRIGKPDVPLGVSNFF